MSWAGGKVTMQITEDPEKTEKASAWRLGSFVYLCMMSYHITYHCFLSLSLVWHNACHQSEVWSVKVKDRVQVFPLIFQLPLLSGCTAEPPQLLIPGLQRTLGECFDKGVGSFIPPHHSEVNYRYNNQFHATRQRFYVDGEEKWRLALFIWVNYRLQ